MTETQIQTSIINYLRNKFPEAVVFKHSDKTRCGIPDIQFIWDGVPIWFEVKTPRGVVSEIQKWTIRKLHDNGQACYIVRSLQEVKDVI